MDSVSIACGGMLPDFTDQITVPVQELFHTTCSRQRNARNAVELGVATGAEYVLKLEDDLNFCDDFIGSVGRWLEEVGRLKTPMFTLGLTMEPVSQARFQSPEETIWQPGPSYPRVREAMREGKYVAACTSMSFWGAQALVFTRQRAEEFVEWLGPDPFFFDGKAQYRHRGHDLLVAQWATSVQPYYLAIVPSLVQHVGQESNLSDRARGHKQPFFQFPWVGADVTYAGHGRWQKKS